MIVKLIYIHIKKITASRCFLQSKLLTYTFFLLLSILGKSIT